jgi:menaquinone-dependent protoporphyrinogen oxidase
MTQTKISRRRFLQGAGGVLGGALLSCAGLRCAPLTETDQTDPAEQPEMEMIDTTFGKGNTMDKKILVTYASQAGSTSGVAEALGMQFAAGGAAVDVRPVTEVSDLSAYRAVVLGSPIHGGEWMPEAVAFVKDHQRALSDMPTAYFLVCMMATKDTEESRKYINEWLEPIRSMVKPVAEGHFAGALWPKGYPFTTAIGLRVFLAYLKKKEGDYRDWEAIRDWAEKTRPALLGAA